MRINRKNQLQSNSRKINEKFDGSMFAVVSANGNRRLKLTEFLLIFAYHFTADSYVVWCVKKEKDQLPKIHVKLIQKSKDQIRRFLAQNVRFRFNFYISILLMTSM